MTAAEIETIAEHCSFTAMKSNPSVNYDWLKDQGLLKSSAVFIRKGIVGDWKNYFTQDMAQEFDNRTKNLVSEIGFTPYAEKGYT